VDLACGWREAWDIQFGGMCRIHDGAVGISDGDGGSSELFVFDGQITGAKVSSAASVGDGGGANGGGDGRT
jgi:hypothetical protein